MREQRPSNMSRVPLHPAAVECLQRGFENCDTRPVSGSSSDGRIGWIAKGGALEVFNLQTGARVAAWCFGAVLKDPSTLVTAVCEYCYDGSRKLVVATATSSTVEGMLCLFNVKTSRVMKTVDIPHRVMALEVVTAVDPTRAPAHILSEHLKHFCGIIAVGTLGGHVYLLDMCIDEEENGSDELSPSAMLIVDLQARDIASKRYNAVNHGNHISLHLGEECHGRGYYEFRKPDDSVVKRYNSGDVYVSSLLFTPQTGLLSVGYSFGCFQLWHLQVPVLVYSSRFVEGLYPITHFAHQEPENDPRNFCYMWVAWGPGPCDDVEDYMSSIKLFQLGFDKKTWFNEFGYLFEDLVSVGPRFEHELTGEPFALSSTVGVGSRVVSCYTLEDPNYQTPERREDDSFSDGSGAPDLSLCVLVWEAAAPNAQSSNSYWLGLFDMNRWYHTQMPASLRPGGYGTEVCPYWAFYSLNDVLGATSPDDLRAVHVWYNSIAKFPSASIPAPEQHFYPASLAFNGGCITDSSIMQAKFLGIQRQILKDMQEQGPMCLVEPANLYNMCSYAGLLPRSFELGTSTMSVTYRREALLTAAVDHSLVGFLVSCASQWASGDLSGSGCSLKLLLDWAWKRLAFIKDSIDKLCVPLYDWSGVPLDQLSVRSLHQHQITLSHLVTLFQAFITQTGPTTEQGRQELHTRLNVCTLISQHLNVTMWLHTNGFLPEGSETVQCESIFPYPANGLAEKYKARRTQVQKLHSELKSGDVLFIDGFIEQNLSQASDLWEKDGGSGLFPPPSMHGVTNMYLLDKASLRSKNSVVLYLLMDLLSQVPEEQQSEVEEQLEHFCQAMKLPLATAKYVQGMWFLDHHKFEDAMYFLLQPSVRAELLPTDHTRVIKACLYQNQSRAALRYLRLCRPPLRTREDVKLKLTVLLANGLTSEAFEFRRLCRDQLSDDDLLSHIFLGCDQMKVMDQLLQLPFSEDEERHLVSFLKSEKEMRGQELLVMYYLQRGRISEAIRLNSQLHVQDEDNVKGHQRSSARNCIVEGYRRAMPRIHRHLVADPCRPMHRQKKYVRPTPLSTIVHKARSVPTVTRATLIKSIMEKTLEVNRQMTVEEPAQTQQPEPVAEEQDVSDVPFICTPVTPRAVSRLSETAEVVFPGSQATSPMGSRSAIPGFRPSPTATRLLQTSVFSPGNMSRFPLSPDRPRSASIVASAEAMSLLQTPPLKRRPPSTPSLERPPLAHTPQSILKMKHRASLNASLNLSSVKEAEKPKLPHPRQITELVMPTPPPPTRVLSNVQQADPGAAGDTGSAPGTPKQLRFSEPFFPDGSTEEEKSPLATPPKVSPQYRTVKDRSPTPERQSPKMAPLTDTVSPSKMSDRSEDVEMEEESSEDDNAQVLPVPSRPAAEIMISDSGEEDGEGEEEAEEQESEIESSEIESPPPGTRPVALELSRIREKQLARLQEQNRSFRGDRDSVSPQRQLRSTAFNVAEEESKLVAQDNTERGVSFGAAAEIPIPSPSTSGDEQPVEVEEIEILDDSDEEHKEEAADEEEMQVEGEEIAEDSEEDKEDDIAEKEEANGIIMVREVNDIEETKPEEPEIVIAESEDAPPAPGSGEGRTGIFKKGFILETKDVVDAMPIAEPAVTDNVDAVNEESDFVTDKEIISVDDVVDAQPAPTPVAAKPSSEEQLEDLQLQLEVEDNDAESAMEGPSESDVPPETATEDDDDKTRFQQNTDTKVHEEETEYKTDTHIVYSHKVTVTERVHTERLVPRVTRSHSHDVDQEKVVKNVMDKALQHVVAEQELALRRTSARLSVERMQEDTVSSTTDNEAEKERPQSMSRDSSPSQEDRSHKSGRSPGRSRRRGNTPNRDVPLTPTRSSRRLRQKEEDQVHPGTPSKAHPSHVTLPPSPPDSSPGSSGVADVHMDTSRMTRSRARGATPTRELEAPVPVPSSPSTRRRTRGGTPTRDIETSLQKSPCARRRTRGGTPTRVSKVSPVQKSAAPSSPSTRRRTRGGTPTRDTETSPVQKSVGRPRRRMTRSITPNKDLEEKTSPVHRRQTRAVTPTRELQQEESVTAAPTRRKPGRPRRSVDQQEAKADEPMNSTAEIPADGGPLAGSSFMMGVRSGQEQRETTPEKGTGIPDEMGFIFSPPVSIDIAKEEKFEPASAHSFIFSPPLTRQRRRLSSIGLTSDKTPDSAKALFTDSASKKTPPSPAAAKKKKVPTATLR